MKDIIKDYKRYLSNEESLKDSEEIAKNETGELKKLADEEIRIAKEEISSLEKNLEISLLPEDPNDNSNVFLEYKESQKRNHKEEFILLLLQLQ